jgi:hypothetical protein
MSTGKPIELGKAVHVFHMDFHIIGCGIGCGAFLQF